MQSEGLEVSSISKEYFHNLIQKHPSALSQVQKLVEQQVNKFEDEIQQGRYVIRNAVTPVLKKRTQQSSQDVSIKDMIQLKRDLQNKLNLLQSNLEQFNRTKQSSPKQKVEISKKQHDDFVRQMMIGNKKLLQRRILRRQRQLNDSREKQEEQKRLEDTLRIQREKKRKEKIEEKLRQACQLKQLREKQLEAQNRILASLIHTKPLYEKIQDSYSKCQINSLQEKKKKLAQIRSLHKPISKEELDQHLKKFQALKEKKQLQRKQRFNGGADIKDPREVFHSHWYKKILQKSKTQELSRNEEDYTREHAKEMKEKLKQYAQYVRYNFKPEIDSEKNQRLKAQSPREIKHQLKPEQIKKIGLDYLRYSKEHIIPNKTPTEPSSPINQPPPPKPINYLQQLKKNRSKSSFQRISNQLDVIINKPIQEKEKKRLIAQHVTKLQEMVKRKEQFALSHSDTLDQELDEIYMKTAKAKLALLN